MLGKHVARLADALFEKLVRWTPQLRPFEHYYDQSIAGLEAKAEAGDADAAYVLGDIYDQGYNCVGVDQKRALFWYERAAEMEQPDALNNIGSMYQHGDGGMEVDLVKAREYYVRAVAAGCGGAMSNLAHFYSNGRGGLEADPKKAMKLFKAAVRQGYANAAVSVGYRYDNGVHCRKSVVKALYWYRVAEKADDAQACYNLAVTYYHGDGVPQDHARAVALLRRGVEQRHPASCWLLGMAYEFGRSVDEDLERSLELYERASDLGFSSGAKAVDRVLDTLGEQLSEEDDAEARIADLRQMVFNPQKRFRVRALLHELARLDTLLREEGRMTPVLEGQMKLAGGYAQWMTGDPACGEWVDAALGIDHRHPFLMPFERAALLHARARLLINVRAWRKAIATLSEAQDLSHSFPDHERIAHLGIPSDLGYCLHEAGDYEEARRVNRALLARIEAEEEEPTMVLIRTLANLAQNEFALENHPEVVLLYERRLEIVEKMDDEDLLSSTLRDLAIAAFHVGRAEEAEGLFNRRITLAEKQGSPQAVLAAQADRDELLMRISKAQVLQ